ncbi:noncanonical pyrimidine nucleotidase, YjjG family [Bizionia gelidisalsuginis]|uniref:Noncanonical pyrimidine nucleotidase, YjjG family n=2 Tax=Bizionia TaxID=283785 RepID=A0A8H2LDU9_9FLAO|nr:MULTISPECIES: YjjG family noncanonical pyrimidine nucleotidase [Bizionia]TYB73888.1 noncanonical pyrimidine nucleotidase, YjjG family [Bizionia saleffrena]TYC12851.1 noncanonical pyrimidine nucleotidase, YjjG family [Bizionia gelidisalsuginis]
MSHNITDVFFDLDHTLWDFDKNSSLTFEMIFKMNDISLNLNDFISIYEPINLKYWKLYREEKVDKVSLRYGRLSDAFKALNITIEDVVINKLAVDYITYLTSYNHIFEGTIELLEYLKPKYNLHIITNGFGEAQQRKLEKSNISHYFKTVTNSEMVGVKKPNPKMFHFALELAKAKKESSIMIGDNYEADVLGALNIGLDAICFNYHKTVITGNVKQVNTLLEIKSLL